MARLRIEKVLSFTIFLFILFSVLAQNILINSINNRDFTSNNKIELSNSIPTIDLSILPDIDYETLNNTWYEPHIEMLIITPDDQNFIDAVTPLMNWKNEKGVKTIIISNFSLYEGSDNASKIRNMIKEYYEQENIRWVLLAGDAEDNLIPIREVYNPDVIELEETEYSNWDDYYKPTDYYYADLDGIWDEDGDGNWGESPAFNSHGIDEISWEPEVYVGRLPADNAIELALMVNKTIMYEKDPDIGNWMNKMLLAGGVSDFYSDPPEDEARLTEYVWQQYTQNYMNFTHLVKTTLNFIPEIPPTPNQQDVLNHNNFRAEFNSGYSTVFFAGHGDPFQFTDASGSAFYTDTDASNSLNFNNSSLVYADACTTSPYDKNDNNIGEILIKQDGSGAIGYIGGIRVTWYIEGDTNLEKVNRGNAKLFWKEFFEGKKFQQGRALYDSKVSYMNSDYFKRGATSMEKEYQRKNVLAYNLLGDPEVDVYTNIPAEVPNYFSDTYYEGQLISLVIKDNLGRVIPYARVHIRATDGKYRTVYADIDGVVKFRLPIQASETYNMTITGHNLIPSYYNFTTQSDSYDPSLLDLECIPENPSVSDNICFNIQGYDNQSGIESIFLILTNDNFKSYSYYGTSNDFEEDSDEFSLVLNKLEPGKYSYMIVARDYTNKTKIFFEEDYNFSIKTPMMNYTLIVITMMMIGLAGVSFFIILVGFKQYYKTLRKIYT